MSEEPKQIGIRLTKEEVKKLNKVRQRYGLKSYTDALRMAINELVRQIEAEKG